MTPSCGIATTDKAYCWGGTSGIYVGLPPDPDSMPPNSAVPRLVPGELHFAHLTVGGGATCGMDPTGAAFCWGANQTGEIGDSSTVAKLGPSLVRGGHAWRALSAGGTNTCGITLEGRAYCWGNQFRGMLGNGTLTGSRPFPGPISSELTFLNVYAGPSSCALTSEGDAYCWGVNDYGVLGDGEPPRPSKERATPSAVVGGIRFSSLALGTYHMCGIATDQRAYCWGWNTVGQLGNGSTQHTSTPTLVSSDLRWRVLAAGDGHTCGITTVGRLYCWGGNERGEFGNGTTSEMSTVPLLIDRTGRFVSVTAGGNTTCALTAAATAFCWGRGDYGQLGNGAMANSSRPELVVAPH